MSIDFCKCNELGASRTPKRNPWENDSTNQQACESALLNAVMHDTKHVYNISIEKINFSYQFPIIPRLQYYCDLNYAGRRILSSFQPVPLGLWPLLLERAGKMLPNDPSDERRANVITVKW